MARVTPLQMVRKLQARRKRLQQLMVTALNKTLPLLKQRLIKTNLSAKPTATSHSIRRQSGKLQKSVTFSKATPAKGFSVATFTISASYAKVHIGNKFTGRTVIRPRGKFLAIPTRFARKKSGEPIAGPRDPRWGRTFVANDIIFGTLGKNKSVKPLFTLRTSVVVPQRVSVKRDIVKPAQQIYEQKIREGLPKALR